MFKRIAVICMGLLFVGSFVVGLTAYFVPTSLPGYFSRMGLAQGELLWGRIDLQTAQESPLLTEAQKEKLLLVPKIKAFGKNQVGLKSTQNYSRINPTWSYTIYNLQASQPLEFRPVLIWYPIVGTMPYEGFFDRELADIRVAKLKDQGLDVYLRTAGAYSTLGWFEDPLTLPMLKWSEDRLADTILHELAHATLWIAGSVQFNESFANFVGETAARQYLVYTYKEGSDKLIAYDESKADFDQYRLLLHETYKDLEQLYDSELTDVEKLDKKHEIITSLPSRVSERDFKHPERYKKVLSKGTWNNARFIQFRTYNNSHELFAALLSEEGGDLLAFIRRVDTLTQGANDPYEAIREAVQIPEQPPR